MPSHFSFLYNSSRHALSSSYCSLRENSINRFDSLLCILMIGQENSMNKKRNFKRYIGFIFVCQVQLLHESP
uniref:Auxin-induced protein n=1 Tax=Rhizophora mucronata TaxID=61149 RepID=A0A2P2IVF2_RHIMU